MTQGVANALRVKAHGTAVRTLHERGLTWVSFDPIPDLACEIDFGICKVPDLGPAAVENPTGQTHDCIPTAIVITPNQHLTRGRRPHMTEHRGLDRRRRCCRPHPRCSAEILWL